MTAPRHPFEYSVLRVVPRVERAESMNAGVILYCRELGYLGARVHLDVERLRALDRAADAASIQAALEASAALCRLESDQRGVADIGSRFRWLTAPRSTVIQPGPVHTGRTLDAAADLERLLQVLVLPLS